MSAESERFIDDATAIKSGNNFVAVLQANSPKAMGENRIGNAGDICVPGPDGIKVYAGHTGVLAQILHGWTNYVIWPSNRAEGKSGPIDTSWGKPPEAKWVPDPQRPNRNAFLMPGGARYHHRRLAWRRRPALLLVQVEVGRRARREGRPDARGG